MDGPEPTRARPAARRAAAGVMRHVRRIEKNSFRQINESGVTESDEITTFRNRIYLSEANVSSGGGSRVALISAPAARPNLFADHHHSKYKKGSNI
ncbi:hypothetical protein EVAR_48417_1 [Eumeta japonica]|uniref:Uncharacterized protein n=1 Tax=Eumeta variegata TaxID=151549 RepID=A0A4C1XU70_EUMVA|nr:hypothetical protein EVAR_48417_1 [Eumeta japonica]